MKKIILASKSPRRRELLADIGLEFTIDVDESFQETHDLSMDPEEFVKFNALGKARAVKDRHPDSIIISADTIGELNGHVGRDGRGGEILEKPNDMEHAREMLNKLQGQRHRVITGVVAIDTSTGKEIAEAVTTWVTFGKMSAQEIDSYLNSGEFEDKAASFAIQGLGSLFIEGIEGDYFNVVGLPMHTLYKMLKELDVDII